MEGAKSDLRGVNLPGLVYLPVGWMGSSLTTAVGSGVHRSISLFLYVLNCMVCFVAAHRSAQLNMSGFCSLCPPQPVLFSLLACQVESELMPGLIFVSMGSPVGSDLMPPGLLVTSPTRPIVSNTAGSLGPLRLSSRLGLPLSLLNTQQIFLLNFSMNMMSSRHFAGSN